MMMKIPVKIICCFMSIKRHRIFYWHLVIHKDTVHLHILDLLNFSNCFINFV
jgi:hypothetical protein